MMPQLYAKKGKTLFQNWERCKGCDLCLEVCPTRVLVPSAELNGRGAFPPILKPGGTCTFCTLCEFMCPDLAIYILKGQPS